MSIEMHELRTIGKLGDVKISWNKENEDEVKTAREMFEKKIKEGWSAFGEMRLGTKGSQIRTFDPAAQRIVLVPPVCGG